MSRDIPIIFSAPMVRAFLREIEEPGTGKTMTRRLADRMVKTYPNGRKKPPTVLVRQDSPWTKVKVGDRLWIREAVKGHPDANDFDGIQYLADAAWAAIPGHPTRLAQERFMDIFHYRGKRGAPVPGMHMPKWANRFTLIVTATKTEPLQEITEDDAIAEGVERVKYDGADPKYVGHFGYKDYRDHPHAVVPWREARKSFETLWTSLHGEDAWTDNPVVVALSLKVILANIDAPEAKAA